mmetsp:Transcript_139456/g.242552  ORF Transcript_139456/g.242552 Transcript_139456/m.242552 type:complete len:114 (-) Transcript_139456:55-396(-)
MSLKELKSTKRSHPQIATTSNTTTSPHSAVQQHFPELSPEVWYLDYSALQTPCPTHTRHKYHIDFIEKPAYPTDTVYMGGGAGWTSSTRDPPPLGCLGPQVSRHPKMADQPLG